MVPASRSLFIVATLLSVTVHCGYPVMRKMELDEARSMVKEFYEVLSTPGGRAAIDGAAPGKGEGGMKMRLAQVLPVADELTKTVRAKYGFDEGELQDAMQAAGKAGEDAMDKNVADVIMLITEVVMGEESPKRIGRVAELDVLAEGFIALDAEGRFGSARRAQAVVDGLSDEAKGLFGPAAGAATYLDVMGGIIESGIDYVIEKVVENVQLLGREMDEEGAKTQDPTRKAIHVEMNVLSQFLSPADHDAVGKRVEAAMKATPQAVAGGGDIKDEL